MMRPEEGGADTRKNVGFGNQKMLHLKLMTHEGGNNDSKNKSN